MKLPKNAVIASAKLTQYLLDIFENSNTSLRGSFKLLIASILPSVVYEKSGISEAFD
jgi:hypothetical protein